MTVEADVAVLASGRKYSQCQSGGTSDPATRCGIVAVERGRQRGNRCRSREVGARFGATDPCAQMLEIDGAGIARVQGITTTWARR